MLTDEEIKKLTEYQVLVFKDVFFTKEDGQFLENKIRKVQNSLDAVLKDRITKDQEMTILSHKLNETQNWINKAAKKLDLEFKN